MMLSVMLQGFTMGLAYVAPIGMQNLFVINAAVSQSRPRALITALFVTLFDLSLTLACFFGVGAVMDAVPWLGPLMQLAGGGSSLPSASCSSCRAARRALNRPRKMRQGARRAHG